MTGRFFGAALAAATGAVFALGLTLTSAQATPSFDVFGDLADFDPGTGIPNDAFAISTATGITIGLSATQRFFNPPLANDGAGTFFAGPGTNFGDPNVPGGPGPSTSLGSTWNFNYFVGIDPQVGNSNDFSIVLTYDFNPAVGNAGDTGTFDLGSAFALFVNPAGVPEIEDSQNLLFGFLAGVPPLTFITAPGFGPFDPNVAGTYEFGLTIADTTGILASVAIDVVVQVPEPGTLALFGIGILGLGAIRRRRTA